MTSTEANSALTRPSSVYLSGVPQNNLHIGIIKCPPEGDTSESLFGPAQKVAIA